MGQQETTVFEKIDRKSQFVLSRLQIAPIFKKKSRVRARPAVAGERILTKLSSGEQETVNTAKAGDWIVTNPSGEEYIIDEKKFSSRYDEVPGEHGVFQAKGYCRATKNPFGKPIAIMASWGEPQMGDADCWIADVCDARGEKMDGEPYLIDGKAFEETYGPAGGDLPPQCAPGCCCGL